MLQGMFCKHCGKEVNDKAVVCVHCGCSLVEPSDSRAKSRVVYVLLALFLGGFGAHNFYAGYNGKAVTQLSINLLGLILNFSMILVHACGVESMGIVVLLSFLCFLLVSIWVIIDIVTVNKDARGIPFA